jgi:hypothetical protein
MKILNTKNSSRLSRSLRALTPSPPRFRQHPSGDHKMQGHAKDMRSDAATVGSELSVTDQFDVVIPVKSPRLPWRSASDDTSVSSITTDERRSYYYRQYYQQHGYYLQQQHRSPYGTYGDGQDASCLHSFARGMCCCSNSHENTTIDPSIRQTSDNTMVATQGQSRSSYAIARPPSFQGSQRVSVASPASQRRLNPVEEHREPSGWDVQSWCCATNNSSHYKDQASDLQYQQYQQQDERVYNTSVHSEHGSSNREPPDQTARQTALFDRLSEDETDHYHVNQVVTHLQLTHSKQKKAWKPNIRKALPWRKKGKDTVSKPL